MLKANNLGEGSCYLNEHTRRWVAVNLLGGAYRMFEATTRVKQLKELSRMFECPGSDRLEFFEGIRERLDSELLDFIRISACFENCFKALLLFRGFVIHEIDRHRQPALSNKQQTEPIKIVDVKTEEGVKYRRDNDFNYQILLNQTVPLSRLLNKSKYRQHIGGPPPLYDALRRIQERRNTLHFLAVGMESYNVQLVEDLQCVRSSFNLMVVRKRNQLEKRLGSGSRRPLAEL